MYRRILAVVVVAALCTGGWIGLRIEHRITKDRRDLHDLTRRSPWPREKLLVPDDLPPDGALGWLDRNGLELVFDLAISDTRKVPLRWQLHPTGLDGTPKGDVDCVAIAVVTCADLGDGFTFAVSKQAPNSIPSTALSRVDGDRLLSVIVQVPEYVEADALRPVLTRTHRPTDAELLALLRRDEYETDWS
ncbi:hypothetical protein GCM10011608_00700 [Micromonospora sonchi]|uniref:Uncharacterized protein n=1 Tax=Micromonospora sonchi TaxID=1763543 RepID=A0A917TEH7_9ACTN|nr:hypothetical protein [Micromonospora sonchi]GGM19953.1 hypothetical protein GCM10011608_00700 [Micromonospora sonchi]